MGLEEYRRKRDFKKTPEPPPGKVKAHAHLGYLIQKHDATRLHYDFRLELDGVLLSWAVTKGPSLNPADKRLAVRTEDHPVAYGTFEGTIPKGQYGGGTVMLWDEGYWEPKGDPRVALKKGHLTFKLHGERLKGGWALIRMRGDSKHENWLLVKEKDDMAVSDGSETSFLDEHASSITTGRSMDVIAKGTKVPRKEKSQPISAKIGKETKAESKLQKAKAATGKSTDLVLNNIKITHPDRVIPQTGHVTKGELAEYYAAAAPFLLPQLKGRPLSLLRCPGGMDGQCFFQRNPGKGLGPDVKSFHFDHKGKKYEYLYIDNEKGLMEIIQMGSIELHPWGSTVKKIDYPDKAIFDLDPAADVPFEAVKLAAMDLHERLKQKNLESFVKTTGGKGLHVIVPLSGKDKWPAVKAFAKNLAHEMVDDAPDAYVATMSKAKRNGKIFIDFFRNDYTATAIADYGVRARPGGPVAVPLEWKELKTLKTGNQFTMSDILMRFKKLGSTQDRYKAKQRLP